MSIIIKKIDESSEMKEEKLLLHNMVNSYRHGFCLYGKEEICLPSHYEDIYEKMLHFDVRNDDVFIISFPKTGTTWCQEMVWLISNNLDYESAKIPISIRSPFIEVQGVFSNTKWIGARMNTSVEYVNNLPSPRYIKCHLPVQLLPIQIQNKTKSPKIIYVCRNPKDCLVSCYHHAILYEGLIGSFDDFYKLFISERVSYAPYWGHILDFWKRRHDENVLFLRYEDMKADLPSILKKVASFLSKSYTNEQIQKLANHLSFENMKKNPAVNYEKITEANRKAGFLKAKGSFMRCGKVGDFKNYMSQEQIAQMDTWTAEHIKGTDFVPFNI